MMSDTIQKPDSAKDLLAAILERMGIEATINESQDDESIMLQIDCSEPERITGSYGQVLDALQHLIGKIWFRHQREQAGTDDQNEWEGPRWIRIDANGYREKKREALETLAGEMAEKASSENDTIALEPMKSYERRIIHSILAEDSRVETKSHGRGAKRHVLIMPVSESSSAVHSENNGEDISTEL